MQITIDEKSEILLKDWYPGTKEMHISAHEVKSKGKIELVMRFEFLKERIPSAQAVIDTKELLRSS